MKKILSALISLVFVINLMNLSMSPVSAITSGDYDYEIINTDEAEITGYNGAGGNVIIPATIDGFPVTSIGATAFYINSIFTDITLPDGLINIGDSAFAYNTGLTDIIIPDSVLNIGNYAFQGCINVTSVDIGSSVEFIGVSAFLDCASLLNISVDPANTAFVAIDDVLFDYDITILFQYPTAKAGGYAIPDGVLEIGEKAFIRSESLTAVTIPDSVADVGTGTFAFCTSLQTASLGNGLTTTGDEMFNGCVSLTDVSFGTLLQTIGNSAFSDCSLLDNVAIPNSVVTIGASAFSNCTGMNSLAIGNGVTVIGDYAFLNCVGLSSIVLPSGLSSIGISSFDGCTGITGIIIPDSVVSIGDFAFYGCALLENVSIGSGTAVIGDWAFEFCVSLAAITVAPSNLSYASLDGVLFDESMILLIRYPNARAGGYSIPQGVVEISDSAFSSADVLTDIYIPDSVTTINDFAFYLNESLINVTFGNSVATIGDHAFEYCTAIESIFFTGDAPVIGPNTFSNIIAPVIVFYAGGAAGFTDPWNGMTTFSAIEAAPTTPTTDDVIITINYPFDAADMQYMIGAGPWLEYTGQIALTSNNTVSARFTDPLANVISLGTIEISNIERILTSITVTTPPTKTDYIEGQSFDPTGMVVSGTFSDDSTEILAGYTYSPDLTAGQTSLTVFYQEFEATTPITVVAKTVTGIALKTAPVKVTYLIGKITYLVGEDLDLTGGEITLSYNDGTTMDFLMTDPDVIISGYNKDLQTLGASTQTITVNYTGFVDSVSFDVRVLALGDVNNDGTITSIDALQTLQGSTGKLVLSAEKMLAADANRSGTITTVDALRILQKSTGKIPEL